MIGKNASSPYAYYPRPSIHKPEQIVSFYNAQAQKANRYKHMLPTTAQAILSRCLRNIIKPWDEKTWTKRDESF
jgi:hypothetical protein